MLVLDDDLVAGVLELHAGNVVRRLEERLECIRVDRRVERLQLERVDIVLVGDFREDGSRDILQEFRLMNSSRLCSLRRGG